MAKAATIVFARTGKPEDKARGVSALLVPMDLPGEIVPLLVTPPMTVPLPTGWRRRSPTCRPVTVFEANTVEGLAPRLRRYTAFDTASVVRPEPFHSFVDVVRFHSGEIVNAASCVRVDQAKGCFFLLQVAYSPAENRVLQDVCEVACMITMPIVHVFGRFPRLSGLTPLPVHV